LRIQWESSVLSSESKVRVPLLRRNRPALRRLFINAGSLYPGQDIFVVMILSLKERLLSFVLNQNWPRITLQPVLPEKRDFVRSSTSEGVLPAAVSDASTGCRNHVPPRLVESEETILAGMTAALLWSEGSVVGDWQEAPANIDRQMAARNFIIWCFDKGWKNYAIRPGEIDPHNPYLR
jgi:hypothetical protein